MSTPVLVLSHTYHLLPLASRLVNEGHDVKAIIRTPEFESAWMGGNVTKLPSETDLGPWIAAAEAGELTIITDSLDLRLPLANVPPEMKWEMSPTRERPESGLRLGVWVDSQGIPHHPHWLFVDRGLNPTVDLSATLVWEGGENAHHLSRLLTPLVGEWKELGFSGLAQVGLTIDGAGAVEVRGSYLGWPPLHLALFVAGWQGEVGNLFPSLQKESMLEEFFPQGPLYPYYTVGTVAYTAPWPWLRRPRGRLQADRVRIDTPTEALGAWWFWGADFHDHDGFPGEGEIWSAGLDGCIGVLRAQGRNLTTAQLRLQALGQGLPSQVQTNLGVGSTVPMAQAALEQMGLVVTPPGPAPRAPRAPGEPPQPQSPDPELPAPAPIAGGED